MATLKIRKEMIPLIRSGAKISTSRYGIRDIGLNEELIFMAAEDSSDTVKTKVTEIQHCQFNELTEEEAIAEGYSSLEKLKSTLQKLYNPGEFDYFTLIKFIQCEGSINEQSRWEERINHV